MFGQSQFARVNSLINEVFANARPVIVAHRGAAGGSIVENTVLGVRAALMSGADMVEIDVTASRDGRFYCFHDGFEAELLGIDTNLQTLSADEIDGLAYIWRERPGRRAAVEPLDFVMRQFRGRTVFNVDRSWWRWPALLHFLDKLQMTQQVLLKCPAWESTSLDQLRKHPQKYPFMPICNTIDDAEPLIDDPQLNVVGLELITTTQDSPWFDKAVIDDFHRRGVFCFVNTETLTTGVPLFGGLDDETAIRVSPEAAWGPVLDLGVDAIQTDWPWLMREFRSEFARPQ